jgi:hypothetical protein
MFQRRIAEKNGTLSVPDVFSFRRISLKLLLRLCISERVRSNFLAAVDYEH